jgi:hypothetical protein
VRTLDSGDYGDGVVRRTDVEKRSICFQTTADGVSVAQVARRYAVNANLIFKWLRDRRCAPEPAAALLHSSASDLVTLFPTMILGERGFGSFFARLGGLGSGDGHGAVRLAQRQSPFRGEGSCEGGRVRRPLQL